MESAAKAAGIFDELAHALGMSASHSLLVDGRQVFEEATDVRIG